MASRRVGFVVMNLGLLLALAGCQLPLAKEPGPELLQQYAQSPAAAPSPIKPGEELSPLREGTWTYHYRGDEFKGDVSTLRTERSEDDPSIWLRHAAEYKQIRYLQSDGKGGLVMSKVIDSARNAITTFEPALPVLKVDIAPNEPVTYESNAVVYFLSNPDRQMDSGTCRMTITHDADQVLTTPAGTFNTRRFKMHFETDFKIAKLNSVAWIYYADGVGIVAEYYAEEGRAFILPWSKKRTIVLTDYPKEQ